MVGAGRASNLSEVVAETKRVGVLSITEAKGVWKMV